MDLLKSRTNVTANLDLFNNMVNVFLISVLKGVVLDQNTKGISIYDNGMPFFCQNWSNYSTVTLIAAGPFAPCSISNVTRSPS